MKTRIFNNIALAVSLLVAFSSCQKDDYEVFDKSVSTRTSEYIAEIKDVLTGAENGWLFYYFPEKAASSMMTLAFSDTTVSVSSERNPSLTETSFYRTAFVDGVSILFDTYNSILHADATPSHSAYQGHGGDFDFRVISACPDSVILRGVRNGTVCRMYPLKETSQSYLEKVRSNIDEIFVVQATGRVGGGDVVVNLDPDKRIFSIGRLGAMSSEFTEAHYIIDDKGIQLNQPLEYNGEVFYDIRFDSEKNKLIAGNIVFDPVVPEGFLPYAGYLGKYTMTTENGSFPVELKQKEKGSSYYLGGLNPNYSVEVQYKKASGSLEIVYQELGVYENVKYLMCPFDSNSGYYTWSAGVGLAGLVEDTSVDDFSISFGDNGIWSGYSVTSFLIRRVDPETDKPTNDKVDPAMYFASGSDRLLNPSMKKIVE